MTPWTCMQFQDCGSLLLFDYYTPSPFLPQLLSLTLSDNLSNPLTCHLAIRRGKGEKKGGKSITFINFSYMTHSFQIDSLFLIPSSHKLGYEGINWNRIFLIKWADGWNGPPMVQSSMQMVCRVTVNLWHLCSSNGFAVFQSYGSCMVPLWCATQLNICSKAPFD